MDKNNDDKLTLDEFREGSKADPRIVQALSLGDTWKPKLGVPNPELRSLQTRQNKKQWHQQNLDYFFFFHIHLHFLSWYIRPGLLSYFFHFSFLTCTFFFAHIYFTCIKLSISPLLHFQNTICHVKITPFSIILLHFGINLHLQSFFFFFLSLIVLFEVLYGSLVVWFLFGRPIFFE